MSVKLYVCGTRGSFPTFGKPYEGFGQATTCYVIREEDYAILLDCGTGLVNAVPVLQGCKRVDVILSHVHYDHLMGLFIIQEPCPGLKLTFYGNFDAWTAVSSKGRGGSHTFWPETIKNSDKVAVKPGQEYQLDRGFRIRFAPSTHGNGALMTEISRNGKRFVFTGDYEELPGNCIREFAKNADWLLYDGSYAPEEYPGHEGWGHSTWKQGCELCVECNVGKLLITHYANTHDDASLVEEEKRARQIMAGVSFAREGTSYPLTDSPEFEPIPFVYLEEPYGTVPVSEEPDRVKVQGKKREAELKKIALVGWLRKKSFVAAAVNLLIFALSGLTVYSAAAKSGLSSLMSCPMLLQIFIGLIAILLSIRDLKSIDIKEGSFIGRPLWANIALLFGTSAAVVNLFTMLLFFIPAEGSAALTGGQWPGGFNSGILIPALIIFSFLFLEARARINVVDMAAVFGLFLLTHAVSAVYTVNHGLTGLLYSSFTEIPYILLYTALYEMTAIAVFFVNRILLKKGTGYKEFMSRGTEEKKGKKIFSTERERQELYLFSNLLVAVLSLISFLRALPMQQGFWFANPLLIDLLLVIVCTVSAWFNIQAFRSNSVSIYPIWYKYLAYTRFTGILLNFFTVYVIGIGGQTGLSALTEMHWGTGALVLFLEVLLMGITFFMESQEYGVRSAIAAGLTFPLLLIASKIGLEVVFGGRLPEFETANFYAGGRFIISLAAEVLIVLQVFTADRIYIDNARFQSGEITVKRNPDGCVELTVCGARGGIAPTKSAYYEFGQAANCYVIRDGSYGMILDCGSGLVYAPEALKGCTDVDVFLSDTRFSTVMGLLAVPNPCPGAKIRFFGPFGRGTNFENMNGFATPPLWPVNVIVGECISATPDKDIRLNNLYSVRFTPAPNEDEHYVLRISGAVSICYTGALEKRISEDADWAKDCDVLIADGHISSEETVHLAKKDLPGYVLIGNHEPYADDRTLAETERKARKNWRLLSYARQGRTYQIS